MLTTVIPSLRLLGISQSNKTCKIFGAHAHSRRNLGKLFAQRLVMLALNDAFHGPLTAFLEDAAKERFQSTHIRRDNDVNVLIVACRSQGELSRTEISAFVVLARSLVNLFDRTLELCRAREASAFPELFALFLKHLALGLIRINQGAFMFFRCRIRANKRVFFGKAY